jgi:hypothetical protein
MKARKKTRIRFSATGDLSSFRKDLYLFPIRYATRRDGKRNRPICCENWMYLSINRPDSSGSDTGICTILPRATPKKSEPIKINSQNKIVPATITTQNENISWINGG